MNREQPSRQGLIEQPCERESSSDASQHETSLALARRPAHWENRLPAARNGMPTKDTVDLYSRIVLPRLAESPQTQEQLDVPSYALKHLQAHGLVASKMYRVE